MRKVLLAGALLSASMICHPASADAAVFSASWTGVGLAGPDASCAPSPFRGIVSPDTTAGSSNFGGFTYSHNICFFGPSGPVQGSFELDFGDGLLQGTIEGLNNPAAIPGTADLAWTFNVLGGTGRFLGATGSFSGIGLSDARNPPSRLSFSVTGTLNTVPEPGTWGMMLVGFALAGASLRRARAIRLQPLPA